METGKNTVQFDYLTSWWRHIRCNVHFSEFWR